MSSILPSLGGSAFTLIAFVIALSVIVAIHEYGHYIVGRWSGIHAEVFSLGFGPVLYSRLDKHGTKWQIAALPFGGYVKFLGDKDAASAADPEALDGLSQDEKRRTMHGAPLWARAATVAAGPLFNFILSALVFTGVFFFQGTAKEPLTLANTPTFPGLETSIEAGDEIVSIDGILLSTTESFRAEGTKLGNQSVLPYVVKRDGVELRVDGPHPFPAQVVALAPRSAAYEAGLEVGDVITATNGVAISTFEDLRQRVISSDGKPLLLSVWRAGETLEQTLTPKRVDMPLADGSFDTRWLIGITGGLPFELETETAGLWAALTGGITQIGYIIRSSLSGLYNMIIGEISSCNMSGPLAIAQTSGAMASQGSQSFIYFIGVLSTAVGLMNLFPIPVLDGGHLVFYAYEAVFRRPPNERVLNLLMAVGLTLLLSLMAFALMNDIFCP
ncbi:MAG: RIP metalloprotease RseP [Halocynthiibacter sp.]